MNNTTESKLIISWGTRKEENGTFTALVTGTSYKHHETIREVKGFATRARAEGWAKKAMRYEKHKAA